MRKGQVTLFIIIGIILLFTMTLLIYYRAPFRERFTPYSEQVPAEVLPLKHFITKCIEQTAKRGITALARQGGIINSSQLSHNPQTPTEGNALPVISGWTVPYWWHMASSNTCQTCAFREFTPAVHKGESVQNAETQLAVYISEQLPLCTSKFTDFPSATVNEERPSVDVFIAEDAVQVNVLYPVHATINGKTHTLTKFYSKEDVKLPQLYKTAQAIVKEEAKQRFLEMQAMELVTIYTGLDRKKLPPVSETLFFPKALFWLTTEVRENLQNILGAHIHLFRMRTASNALHKRIDERLPYSAVISRVYDSFLVPISTAVPYQTHFQYFPEWPIYLSLNDKGGIILPEKISPQILPIPLVVQRYSAVYDFSYPVLIELYDEQAFNGQGLSFFFAMEGNVRANGPMNVTMQQLETIEGEEGMLCDPLTRNTQNTTITVHDEVQRPLNGAFISFSAGDTCLIGETDTNGVLETPFPVGIGILSVLAQNTMTISQPITIQLDMSSSHEVIMPAGSKIPIIMKAKQLLHDSHDTVWHIGGLAELTDKDTVLVTFERRQGSGEGAFRQAAQFSKDSGKQDVDIASGTYDVHIIAIQDTNVTLLPKKHCVETGGVFGIAQQEQCFTIPEEVTTLPAPPLAVDTTITITPEDVRSRKQISLYYPTVVYPSSPTYEDIFVDPEVLTGFAKLTR